MASSPAYNWRDRRSNHDEFGEILAHIITPARRRQDRIARAAEQEREIAALASHKDPA